MHFGGEPANWRAHTHTAYLFSAYPTIRLVASLLISERFLPSVGARPVRGRGVLLTVSGALLLDVG